LSPERVSAILWAVWALSWFTAMAWSRRTERGAGIGRELAYRAVMSLGAILLFVGVHDTLAAGGGLWALPRWAGWSATALVAAGFLFCWWARLTLGDLWSGSVTRKEEHVIVRAGPYGLVRHPIYTGLILAAAALAIQTGSPMSIAGSVVFAIGCWMKARLEEGFLSAELGVEVYGDYRRATPMLVPFLPVRQQDR
jgi:protein-S-isoprenylcysteine O-methyltransferase Ste14